MTNREAQVVIVGAGFGGLAAAKALAGRSSRTDGMHVVVIDKHNHHTFTPFLYQVATALLEPTGAGYPARSLLRKLPGVEFRIGEVTSIDVNSRQVQTDCGPIPYDYLILAAGAVNDNFGNSDIAEHSCALNELGEALSLRNRIISCFEAAAWSNDPAERARLLTFAVVGGGPTGVEFTAALSVLVRQMTSRDLPEIDIDEVIILLIEASDSPLTSFPPRSREVAVNVLRDRGVQVESGVKVSEVSSHALTLEDGRHIEAATVVWSAGVRANPLAETLPATGSHGRVIVKPTLQVERHPEVFVVGDMAEIPAGDGPLPMLAQVAIQSGRHAGKAILGLREGTEPGRFRYRNLGTMAALGRGQAVAQIGKLQLSGLSGWLAWLGLHIARTTGIETKATVLIDWLSGLVFANRPVRLITGPHRSGHKQPPPVKGPSPAGSHESPNRGKVDLPSVSVSNANQWGPAAALAWWGQDYPGSKKDSEQSSGNVDA